MVKSFQALFDVIALEKYWKVVRHSHCLFIK